MSITIPAQSANPWCAGHSRLEKYVAMHGVKDQTLLSVQCGANIDFDRCISERTQIGEKRETVLA